MASCLPRRAVKVVDAWFDVLNRRSPYDPKKERCGYGLNAEVEAQQDEALAAIDDLVRKVTPKQPLGRASLLPCQHGVLRTNALLRGLHTDLRAACPGLQYVMSSHLNQDCVENAFSQFRACVVRTPPLTPWRPACVCG